MSILSWLSNFYYSMIAINPLCKFALTARFAQLLQRQSLRLTLCYRPLFSTVEYIFGVEPKPPPRPRRSSSRSKRSSNAGLRNSSYSSTASPPASLTVDRTAEQSSNTSTPKKMGKSSVKTASNFSIDLSNAPPPVKTSVRVAVKLGVTATMVAVAIFFPGFENIMAFLGAFSCFVICVHGPILVDIALNWSTMSLRHKVLNWVLLFIATGTLPFFPVATADSLSTGMCVTGTVFAFLPQKK